MLFTQELVRIPVTRNRVNRLDVPANLDLISSRQWCILQIDHNALVVNETAHTTKHRHLQPACECLILRESFRTGDEVRNDSAIEARPLHAMPTIDIVNQLPQVDV